MNKIMNSKLNTDIYTFLYTTTYKKSYENVQKNNQSFEKYILCKCTAQSDRLFLTTKSILRKFSRAKKSAKLKYIVIELYIFQI